MESWKKENDAVFHKFRIKNTQQAGKDNYRCVSGGISANSWFTPRGFAEKSGGSMAPYGPVTEEIRNYLRDRAQSAGAMFGRRFYDCNKQTLKTGEFLQGSGIFDTKKIATKVVGEENKIKANGSSSNTHSIRSKLLLQRPHTSHERQTGLIRNTEVLEPKVEAIVLKNKSQITEKNCFMCQQERQQSGHGFDSSHINNEFVETKAHVSTIDVSQSLSPEVSGKNLETIRKRIQSAPCYLSTKRTFRNAKEINGISHTSRTAQNEHESVPLYWKTRSSHHRKLLKPEVDTDGDHDVSMGTLLKPLMYKEEFSFKHSAGCPYKCKSCFRACLASQDYIENLTKPKPQANRPIRPKHYHRRIVEMALAQSQPVNKFLKGVQDGKNFIN